MQRSEKSSWETSILTFIFLQKLLFRLQWFTINIVNRAVCIFQLEETCWGSSLTPVWSGQRYRARSVAVTWVTCSRMDPSPQVSDTASTLLLSTSLRRHLLTRLMLEQRHSPYCHVQLLWEGVEEWVEPVWECLESRCPRVQNHLNPPQCDDHHLIREYHEQLSQCRVLKVPVFYVVCYSETFLYVNWDSQLWMNVNNLVECGNDQRH